MFRCTKNDIHAFPFEECATLKEAAELEEWASLHGLTNFNFWMLPQILAYFGQLRVKKNADGLYDPKLLMTDNFRDNDWAVGLWRVCTKLKRSALVKAQMNPQFAEYSALVPLILAGLKKYQNIPYSAWSAEGLSYVIDKGLYEAMMCNPPDLPLSRVLELRQQGLMTKSGPKSGQLKNALNTWTLTGIKNTEWGELPPLALTMLAQIWVAHPSIRNSYMVLDPNDWDAVPDSIITTDVLGTKPSKPRVVEDLPWDQ